MERRDGRTQITIRIRDAGGMGRDGIGTGEDGIDAPDYGRRMGGFDGRDEKDEDGTGEVWDGWMRGMGGMGWLRIGVFDGV
eukprot:723369-Hanusia_phi.AAC.1